MHEQPLHREDRDLLIELRTEMKSVRQDIRELSDTTKMTIQDHEARLRFIERYMWLAIGALTLAQLAINYFK